MRYYKPSEYCKICQGSCCKKMPGTCLPRDIEKLYPTDSLKDSIEKALDSGLFAIDWYEDSDRGKPYIRCAVKGIHEKYDHPSWGGECIFLTDTGCKLDFTLRPHNCKIIKPKISSDGSCETHLKMNAKLAWSRDWRKTGIDLWQWGK